MEVRGSFSGALQVEVTYGAVLVTLNAGFRMRPLSLAGLVLLAAGLFVALRGVSYSSHRSDIQVGEFHASLEERRTLPPWIGWTGAALGVALVVAGLRSRRGA